MPYAYIGVVLGVNVGIYGSPMECLGHFHARFQVLQRHLGLRLHRRSRLSASLVR